MTTERLSRAAGHGRPAAPVRLVHLGLGNFFRAHQVHYTDRSPDAAEWGYAAFSGRSSSLSDELTAQGGLYTLITRAADGDRFDVLSALSRTHAADDTAWLGYFESPQLAAVTITVTEAGYVRDRRGGLDIDNPQVQADLEALRRGTWELVTTAPGRLVAGLAARRRADAGPVALVPCDNVPGNGAMVERVVDELAATVDPPLAAWITDSVSTVTTMVDRITPRTAPEDIRTALETTGRDDRCPVVTEPFHEWVLSGRFVAGRPQWDAAGATFTEDVVPYEHRKLWLLNGAHSLLAYAGSIRGHTTVAEAIADPCCRAWVEEWWQEACAHLAQPPAELAVYRAALLDRFENARVRHLLAQIAADGSQKLPIRILPVLRAERAAGRLPSGAARVLGAWVCHLRGLGAPVVDAQAADVVPLAAGPLRDAVTRILDFIDPEIAADTSVTAAVLTQVEALGGTGSAGRPF